MYVCLVPWSPWTPLRSTRVHAENVFLQFWKDSLLNSGLIFLMSIIKSTRVSGNFIILLGGRAMKFSGQKLSFSFIWGSRPMVPIVSFKETTSYGRVFFSMGGHAMGLEKLVLWVHGGGARRFCAQYKSFATPHDG